MTATQTTTATTSRRIAFSAPLPGRTWNRVRCFPAGTPVYVTRKRDGRLTLRIPGTLWEITTTPGAIQTAA